MGPLLRLWPFDALRKRLLSSGSESLCEIEEGMLKLEYLYNQQIINILFDKGICRATYKIYCSPAMIRASSVEFLYWEGVFLVLHMLHIVQ